MDMHMPQLPHALSDQSFAWLQAFFEQASGIRLRPEKKMLVVSRLQKRLEARRLPGFDAYCSLLRDPAEEGERQKMLDALTTRRLGQQNQVLRRLRALGVTVLATDLDPQLTIVIDRADAFRLRAISSCIVTRRTGGIDMVTVELDGCRVAWLEAAP